MTPVPGVDLSPLATVANLAITTFAGVATFAIPFIAVYARQWLIAHTAQMKQQTQTAAAAQADGVIQKGLAFAAQTGADPVHGATAYATVQAPDLFKRLGFDVATEDGKAAVTRMVTARVTPTPVQPATVNLNVDAPPVVADSSAHGHS